MKKTAPQRQRAAQRGVAFLFSGIASFLLSCTFLFGFFTLAPPCSAVRKSAGKRQGKPHFPPLNINSLLSSKPLLREKNVRPGFQEKSGRHIGLKRPYVLGHFEVKQEIWGCLATFLGTVKRRFFLFRYAQAFCDTKRWTSALRNRENWRAWPDLLRENGVPQGIHTRSKGRWNRRATHAV